MITPRNLADSAKTHTMTYQQAALAAGSGVADIPLFRCPKDIIIVKAGILSEGTCSGVSTAGTSSVSTWTLKVGSTSIASRKFDDTTIVFPVKTAYGTLGAISNETRLADDVVALTIVNGEAVNTPAATVEIEYTVNEVT